jgi:hypothetical protein
MSRLITQKNIHYVRAVHGTHKPTGGLEASLRGALSKLPKVGDTEILVPSLGTLLIRFRNTGATHGLYLAIGQGVKDEAMATMGLQVTTASDQEKLVAPSTDRAFKLADAFCYIEKNEVLFFTDGGLRMNAVDDYLRRLLEKGGATPAQQMMVFQPRLNQDKAKVLESGIKSVVITSSAYQATSMLDDMSSSTWITGGIAKTMSLISGFFESKENDPAKKQQIVDQQSEVIVTTEIKVRGGSKKQPLLAESLSTLAKEAMKDTPAGAELIIVAKAGEVKGSEVVLSKVKTVKRLKGQNGLDHSHAWDKLEEYRNELKDMGLWAK